MKYLIWFDERTHWFFEDEKELLQFMDTHGLKPGETLYKLHDCTEQIDMIRKIQRLKITTGKE